MYYVVAGNRNEFDNYIHRKLVSDSNFKSDDYRYVYGPDALRGLENIKGFYIGTYQNRPDIQEIQRQIRVIKSKSVYPLQLYVDGVLLSYPRYVILEHKMIFSRNLQQFTVCFNPAPPEGSTITFIDADNVATMHICNDTRKTHYFMVPL